MAVVDPRSLLSMRSADKEAKWASQFDDLFDQYVDARTLAVDAASPKDVAAAHPSDDLGGFCVPSSHRRHYTIAPSPSPHATAAAFPPLSTPCNSPALSGPAHIEALAFSRPNSPQSSTPTPLASPKVIRKTRSTTTASAHDRRSTGVGVHKTYRKPPTSNSNSTTTSSSSMAQPVLSRSASQDMWAQRLAATSEKFNIPYIYQPGPLSPPPTDKITQWGDSHAALGLSTLDASTISHRPSWSQGMASQSTPNFHSHLHLSPQFTPLASPIEDSTSGHNAYFHQSSPDMPSSSYFTSPFSPDLLSSYQSPHQDHDMPNVTNDGLNFSFGTSPRFQTQAMQPWWPPASVSQHDDDASSSFHHHSRRLSHAMSSSPLSNDSYLATASSSGLGGLGIQGATVESDLAKAYEAQESATRYEPFSHSQSMLITPPRKVRRQTSSGSPSAGSASASPPSPHTISRAAKRTPRGQRRTKPAKQAQRPMSIGFVNYTPDEADVILTGVAPSGSSKTKARREKEALEKHRRLSLLATQAIVAAGGDASALAKEGLFED